MSDENPQSILRQMTHRQPSVTPDVPLTASRAVRLAATRSAQHSIDLTLQVLSVGEDALDLDGLLSELSEDLLIQGLHRDGDVVGFMACDTALCAAAVEVQTLGQVAAVAPPPRIATRADAALAMPFLVQFLRELDETTDRTALEGWTDLVVMGQRIESPRALGFALSDQNFRLIRLSLDLGGADRHGAVLIALPMQNAGDAPPPKKVAPVANWDTEFRATVMAAPAALDAVLHRFDLPLAVATGLEVGQIVPLYGCRVGAVRLEAPDGRTVARARLGQIAGQVAVRITEDVHYELQDLPEPAQVAATPPHQPQLAVPD